MLHAENCTDSGGMVGNKTTKSQTDIGRILRAFSLKLEDTSTSKERFQASQRQCSHEHAERLLEGVNVR